MRLLLDTHVLLWSLADDPRIADIEARLLDEANEVFFSVASLWELAIKIGAGKLDLDVDELRRAALQSGFTELPVLATHVQALLSLPPHHRDPFDRMLVAQARAEPMRLLTADRLLVRYGDHVEVIA